jgi:hypothetical protein
MPADSFAHHSPAAVDPARQAFAIAPHDTEEIAVLRAADSAGDVTLKNLSSGQVIDVRARFVRATGTTAADLVALA